MRSEHSGALNKHFRIHAIYICGKAGKQAQKGVTCPTILWFSQHGDHDDECDNDFNSVDDNAEDGDDDNGYQGKANRECKTD